MAATRDRPAPVAIVALESVDQAARDALLDAAFGPNRSARTAARVRAGASAIGQACLAAVDGGVLAGSVAVHKIFWRGANGTVRPLAWLGPLARWPARQGDGIGVMLMSHALAVLDAMALPVALIGDAPYYGRWGFAADATAGWAMPGPVDRERLLLRSVTPALFSGPANLDARQPQDEQEVRALPA